MEEYNLQEIRIEDYNSIKEYYQMRRPETADSNILDLYIWLNCYPTWYFTNDKGLMWVAKSEDGQYYSSIPCCKDEDLKELIMEGRSSIEIRKKAMEKTYRPLVVDGINKVLKGYTNLEELNKKLVIYNNV